MVSDHRSGNSAVPKARVDQIDSDRSRGPARERGIFVREDVAVINARSIFAGLCWLRNCENADGNC